MKAGRGLFLVVLVLAAAGPLYLLLKISVSPPAEVMTPHPTLLPHAVTWRFWQRVLDEWSDHRPLVEEPRRGQRRRPPGTGLRRPASV